MQAAATPVKSSNAPSEETVLSVKHYTDRMFAFRITRPAAFRFRSGEFVMIGLPGEGGKPLLRAYSIASPSWDEDLEFFSIKVPDGPLTSRLQSIKPGDKVLLGRKSVGTLVHDALTPGKRLYLFSTGTGVAPFASIIRDPETYERFEHSFSPTPVGKSASSNMRRTSSQRWSTIRWLASTSAGWCITLQSPASRGQTRTASLPASRAACCSQISAHRRSIPRPIG